jgi:hypothetical protein
MSNIRYREPKIRSINSWTKEETDTLIEAAANGRSIKEQHAEGLWPNRSYSAVVARCAAIGLRVEGQKKAKTERNAKVLSDLYFKLGPFSTQDIIKNLGCTNSGAHNTARLNGFTRNEHGLWVLDDALDNFNLPPAGPVPYMDVRKELAGNPWGELIRLSGVLKLRKGDKS